MSISVETILADARKLVMRLKEHDTSADHLVSRTQTLRNQLEAMKQFQDSLNELNEVARHRPRLGLIITLAQENSKIRELQQENKELHQSLEDHQSALELIMGKYREQITKLAKANQVECGIMQCAADQTEDLQVKSDKISEMSAIMWRATVIDEKVAGSDSAEMARLKFENQMMRQLLEIELNEQSSDSSEPAMEKKVPTNEVSVQTGAASIDESPFCSGDFATLRYCPPSASTLGSHVLAAASPQNLSASLEKSAVLRSPLLGDDSEIKQNLVEATDSQNSPLCVLDQHSEPTPTPETAHSFADSENLESSTLSDKYDDVSTCSEGSFSSDVTLQQPVSDSDETSADITPSESFSASADFDTETSKSDS